MPLDKHDISWDGAWNVAPSTSACTNHTVLTKALEIWEYFIFDCPSDRILEVTREIDRRFRGDLAEHGFGRDKADYMAPISRSRIHVAWITCCTAYSINDVVALHTKVIKRRALKG